MLAKEIAVLGRVTAAWTTMIAEVSKPDMPQSTQLCSLPPCITMLCLYKVVSCAVDILSTTPANGLGEMRMPATAVQVDLLVALVTKHSTYAYSVVGLCTGLATLCAFNGALISTFATSLCYFLTRWL